MFVNTGCCNQVLNDALVRPHLVFPRCPRHCPCRPSSFVCPSGSPCTQDHNVTDTPNTIACRRHVHSFHRDSPKGFPCNFCSYLFLHPECREKHDREMLVVVLYPHWSQSIERRRRKCEASISIHVTHGAADPRSLRAKLRSAQCSNTTGFVVAYVEIHQRA